MATDDDIARLLPEPPPPRPARREATIAEALRRFDGAPAAPVPAAPRWRPRFTRPQFGVLLSAALIALIGAPAAWISLHDRLPTNGPPAAAAASNETAMMDTADTAPAPAAGAASASAPIATTTAPPPAAALPAPPSVVARNAAPADRPMAACPTADCAPETSGKLAAAPAMKAAPAFAAAPPPPPPPPAPIALPRAAPPPMAESVADRDAANTVVTAARVHAPASSRRGDWNACTIDDPARSLAACRHLVDPAAKGPQGRAAAHLADGLSLAWQGNADGAIAAFDQAIAQQPRLALAYLNRGLARQRGGDLDGARADLDRAVRLAPGAARGYYHRALLLRRRGDASRAAADEQRAVDLDPRYEAVVP